MKRFHCIAKLLWFEHQFTSAVHFVQEDEAIESVVEEFEMQKVDMSDVVLLSDAAQLSR